MTATKTVTTYRITATYERDGHTIDCTSAEVLGDRLSERWMSRDEAERVAEDMQDDIADYDLDPTTEYHVDEVEMVIADVEREDTDDGIVVTAMVDGRLVTLYPTERHAAAGVDGLIITEPEALHAFYFGHAFDRSMADEILALVR